MSDFLEKQDGKSQKSKKVYINKNSMSPTLVTAIDNLLCPESNMFTGAETVKKLMETENLSVAEASKQLSLRLVDVANKLRLLEYTDNERKLILKLEITERCAVKLLDICKEQRYEVLDECDGFGLKKRKAEDFILNRMADLTPEKIRRKNSLRKMYVCDPGFLINSLDKAVLFARQAGLKIESFKSEDEKEYSMIIKVKKNVRE